MQLHGGGADQREGGLQGRSREDQVPAATKVLVADGLRQPNHGIVSGEALPTQPSTPSSASDQVPRRPGTVCNASDHHSMVSGDAPPPHPPQPQPRVKCSTLFPVLHASYLENLCPPPSPASALHHVHPLGFTDSTPWVLVIVP